MLRSIPPGRAFPPLNREILAKRERRVIRALKSISIKDVRLLVKAIDRVISGNRK
jgi:hypothetical protein